MTLVFRKGQLYLSERFGWGNEPNAFQEWRQEELQAVFSKMPDPPTHYAQVEGKAVDLDKASWIQL